LENKSNDNLFRNYLIFWIGQLFSILGSSVVFFTLQWWITDTTEDPIAISITFFAFIITMAITSPIAGIVTDHYDRKKIIIIADSLQAFSTFILILFFMFDLMQYWILMIFIPIRSICQTFHFTTENAIIPTMVPKDKLSRINGINFLVTSFINVAGPVIGGFLLLFLTFQEALWIDIITFLISVVPLLLIDIPSVKKIEDEGKKVSFWQAFKEGFRIIHSIPGILGMMIVFMIINFLNQPRATLTAYYVKVIHGGTVLDFSLVSIFFNIGMLIGGTITAFKKKWKYKMRMIFVAYTIASIGYALLATVPTGLFPLVWFYIAMVGFSMPTVNSLYYTIIHLSVPKDKVGRVVSIDTSLSLIAMPLGTIASGPLAIILGTRNLFFISGILTLIIFTLFYIFTNIRRLNEVKETDINENSLII
jgi:DHA3 family macrolide efflux protein-like MFS transporter